MVAWMRQAVSPQAQTRTMNKIFSAPTGGWVTATNLSEPKKKTAVVLENWFPQRRSVRLRGGSFKKATISNSLAVQSVFAYQAGTANKLFAATSAAIYNITSPASPTTIPATDIAGQTSGFYSTALFTTAGGTYLTIANGTDAVRQYDGTTWTTPAITVATSSTLSHVWAYRNRLFFVQKNSLTAYYLPIDSITGAAAVVSLAGVFQRGGNLLTGCTWSLNAGSGLNDQCVFISTNGEVAIFQGTDPSSSSTWSLVGRYDIGTMLGKNAIIRAGGDVLLGTADGLIPLSKAIAIDRAAISLNSISSDIEPDWKVEAVARTDNWTIAKWPEKNMAIIALPSTPGKDNICFVVNLETGAWAKYTGWDTNCICMFSQYAYFGTSAGTILQAETGGTDDGASYISKYIGQFEDWDNVGVVKIGHLCRSTFIASVPFTPLVSLLANYNTTAPAATSAAVTVSTQVWDSAIWDSATWDTSGNTTIQTKWRSVYGQGFVLAPCVQVTNSSTLLPDAQLITNHFRHSVGAVVV